MSTRDIIPITAGRSHDDKLVDVGCAVENVLDFLRKLRPMSGATVHRREILDLVTGALNPDITTESQKHVINNENHLTLTGALRLAFEHFGLNWRQATDTEQIMAMSMAVVDRELKPDAGGLNTNTGLPMTWQERLSRVVALMIQTETKLGNNRNLTSLRGKVNKAFADAMSDTPSHEWVMTATGPTCDGKGTEQAEYVSPPAMFRMALWNDDIDWYADKNREMAQQVIDQALTRYLAAA